MQYKTEIRIFHLNIQKMKKTFTALVCAILLFSATNVSAQKQKKHTSGLEIVEQIHRDEVIRGMTDFQETLPEDFFSKPLQKLLELEFNVGNPMVLLSTTALSLRDEEKNFAKEYGRDGSIAVGYGMMPFCGNEWESFYSVFKPHGHRIDIVNLVKPYVENADKEMQEKIYKWAKPTMVFAWKQKDDTGKALDMFALWKAQLYMNIFNYQREVERCKLSSFTRTDWAGNCDGDAKIYAFWFRRIVKYHETGKGFSEEDAKKWIAIALRDMQENATHRAIVILNTWQQEWKNRSLSSFNSWSENKKSRKK